MASPSSPDPKELLDLAGVAQTPAEAAAALAAAWANATGTVMPGALLPLPCFVGPSALQCPGAPHIVPPLKPFGTSTSSSSDPLSFGLVGQTYPEQGLSLVYTNLTDPSSVVYIFHTQASAPFFAADQPLAFRIGISPHGHREAVSPLWRYIGPAGRSSWPEFVGRLSAVDAQGRGFVECAEVQMKYGCDPVIPAEVVRLHALQVGDELRFDMVRSEGGVLQVSETLWRESSDLLLTSAASSMAEVMLDHVMESLVRGAALTYQVPAPAPNAGLGTEYAQAVARVKAVQRSDCGRELWRVWCEMRGGKKDPALRPYAELMAFLAEADPGNVVKADEVASLPLKDAAATLGPQVSGQQKPTFYQATSMEHAQLIELVKAFQKKPGGHDLWRAYCERNGGGKRDPAARKVQELQEFLNEMGSGGGAQSLGPMTEHEKLVLQIKQGQRNSDSFKQAWWRHCAGLTTGKEVADPAKHSLESLQAFIAKAPTAVSLQDDEEHQALVAQVKQGQRSSEEFRGAWYTYCSEKGTQKNDPSRHDKEFLRDFLTSAPAQRSRPNALHANRFQPY